MHNIIEVTNLTKEFRIPSYHRHVRNIISAIDNISFQVNSGEIFSFLGSNGSGKSTLIKMLCGLIIPTKGKIIIKGYEVTHAGERIKKYIGLIGNDERNFCWGISGRENLRYFASLYNLFSKEASRRIEELTEFLKMDEYIDRRFYSYSTGMRQRLAIARGLLHDPEILLMDEPMKNLDYESALYLRKIIKDILKRNKTVVFTTIDPREVEALGVKVALLEKGRIVACDLFDNLKNKIINKYGSL
ncbi:MAG: ABC transporter ATP-binding protein [Candidatus Omnitrophica bacterium]|nr:ABC transporter ATP-binding protein [Candidatus Omnitrophota bacterium]